MGGRGGGEGGSRAKPGNQLVVYTAESTRASMERTKMPNLRNGSKGGFESGLT